MSLEINDIVPAYDKVNPMIKDPILAVLVSTQDEYKEAYNKRNFRDDATLARLREITARRFMDMKKIAEIEASMSDEDEIVGRLTRIKIAMNDEASNCLDHGMLHECAAYLRASQAIGQIISRNQSKE
jgi:hypothetical protein